MSDIQIEIVPDESGAPPPELQSILTDDQMVAAASYLKSEYEKAATEMQARNRKAAKWREAMEAVAADAPKMSPMPNASNVTVPLTQTISQSLFAKIKGTFDARDPFWTVGTVKSDSESVRVVKVVEKYLDLLAQSPYDLDMERVKNDLFLETILVGAAFPKVVYEIDRWRVIDPEKGEREVVYHDGPAIDILPIERVFYRRGVNTIDRLPWIGLTTPLTEHELRSMAAHGELDEEAVTSILNQLRTDANDAETVMQKAEWTDQAEQTGLIDVTEFWFFWDVDQSGVPVDLFFTMHVPSGTILRQQYNTLGRRMVVNSKYFHRSFGLTGRGTGQMTESMNDEATNIHNLSNDNMKVANMRMFAVRRQAGFNKEEPMYPGKTMLLDNPTQDIHAIPIGEIYPSIENAESKSWAIAQRAVGLSDTAMGFADQTLGSRDTARGQAMRLQQGDSILGTVTEGLKRTLTEIAQLVWMQLVANKDRVMDRERKAMRLSEEDLGYLEKALSMELSEVPTRLSFSVRTTDVEKTFEQRRQNMMALTQLFAQFATQTIPLASQLYGPAGMQMLRQSPELFKYMERLLLGSSILMEDVFTFFGVRNTQDYVPDHTLLDKLMDSLGQMGQTFMGAGQVQLGTGPGMGMGVPAGQPVMPPQAVGGQGAGSAGMPGPMGRFGG
jgi:hypothetical protein